MNFHGETSPGGSRAESRAVLLAGATARFDHDSRQQGKPTRDGTVLWLLVSSHLGLSLSAIMSALFFARAPEGALRHATWFAMVILSTQVVLCACWAFALRKRVRSTAGLERRVRSAEENALAKSALLATMSHELRSPLNGILGMGSLLSRTALDGRQREQLATLSSCADTMLVMVNDVLDFARLEASKLPIEVTPFDPRAAVDEVLAMNGPRAQEKGIELFAVVDRTIPESVLGDMFRIRQALTNLVSNAVKFTAIGEVELRVSMPRTGWLRFAVSDSGIGIAPAVRARLFRPFSQADGRITKDYGGSGLGLAISRRLVLAMHGTIDFESTPGIGSRFFFELPLERHAPVVATHGSAKRVLIVVPHRGTREGLVEVCAWLGVEAVCAEDLRTMFGSRAEPPASTFCSNVERPFDVAIVDDSLPTDQLEAVAAHPQRSRVVVISRATFAMPSWVRSSLSWPVRQTGVIGALRALLRAGEAQGSLDANVQSRESLPVQHFAEQTRVLLVEDMPVNQIVAQALLSELGITVRLARDGEEALAVLRAETFELVLMDCRLPKLNGFETTRRLRITPGPNQRTPVIALTASTVDGDEAACREAGMDDYLAKPIARTELIRKLERWLPTRLFFSQANARAQTPPDNDVQTHAQPRPSLGSSDLLELEDFMHGFELQVGAAAVQLLASSYRDSAPDRAASLSLALAASGGEPDRSTLTEHAHALRGTVRSMGLKALAARLEQLERACPDADPAFLRSLTTEVAARVLAVSEALKNRELVEDEARAGPSGSAREPSEAVG